MMAKNTTPAQITTSAGGAASIGIAIAVYLTHEQGQPWSDVETTVLGIGIGAAIAYPVLWLEMLRKSIEARLRSNNKGE